MMRAPSTTSRSLSVTSSPTSIIHHGFIHKLKNNHPQRRHSTFSHISRLLGRSNWVQRYMMLCKNMQSDGVMRYLCMGMNKQISWVLPLHSILKICSLSDTQHSLTHSQISSDYHLTSFEIHTPDRIYVIRCYDQHDCEMWMRVIKDARLNQYGDMKAYQSQLSLTPSSLSSTSSSLSPTPSYIPSPTQTTSTTNLTHDSPVPLVRIPDWHVDDIHSNNAPLTTPRHRFSSMPCESSNGLIKSNSVERISSLQLEEKHHDIKIMDQHEEMKYEVGKTMKKPPPHPSIQIRTDTKFLESTRIIETSPCITPMFHSPVSCITSS